MVEGDLEWRCDVWHRRHDVACAWDYSQEDAPLKTPILSLRVRSRRDVLVAQQRARQIAGLLGFNETQRAAVAAAVFEMACKRKSSHDIRFSLRGNTLHVGRLEFTLPDPSAIPPRDDIPWLAQILHETTPLDVFEEMRRQNRDLLNVLREMRSRRAA